MKKPLLLLLFIPLLSFGQVLGDMKNGIDDKFSSLSDGPYVFIKKNRLIEKMIVNGKVVSKTLSKKKYDRKYYSDKATFKGVEKIAALSDIHGQYDLVIELLKNNKIIDKALNWNFGSGHLVIVGDVFDRGEKVNELLWLIYKLEIQAKNKGGRLHFLLGNHEYMVLQKDLRYIANKYKLSSQLLNLDYSELYSDKTIIGRWLLSKSTIIKINDNVFVHGGVSKEFIDKNGVDLEKLNTMMREHIDTPKKRMKSLGYYDLYYGPKGLIWYRGYFQKYGDLKEVDISRILKLLDSKHIVVGHTSEKEVVQLYNNKIFAVDSGIKRGEYGEILIIKNKRFFKGTLGGKLIELPNP